MAKLGVACGPVIDLSLSPQYDLTERRVTQWVVFMMEDDRLESFMVEPPCTTFSPACHPAVRSYANPRGFEPSLPKVRLGTILAFAALTCLFAALRLGKIGVGEQPRRSKMRWLSEWKRLLLLGATEAILASCSYGSPHQKEFGLIGVNADLRPLEKPCTRDHTHIKIQGALTKPSAVYCPGLAQALALLFRDHLRARSRAAERLSLRTDGLEDILSNDVSTGLDWQTVDSWCWKSSAHINLLETASTMRLFRRKARQGGDMRFVHLCDSHASRSVVQKGRSASTSLQVMLKGIAAICIGYGLYPAGRFSPTRLNPADHPTRDSEVPERIPGLAAVFDFDPKALWILANLSGLRRWAANWVRIVLLLRPQVLAPLMSSESYRRHPASIISEPEWKMEFDSTLGYPGEGPCWIFQWTFLSWLGLTLSLCLPFHVVSAPNVSHGDAMRREQRIGTVLGDGRRVTATTAFYREGLLGKFRDWLQTKGLSFDTIVMQSPPDLDMLNQKLVEYGRWLFAEGKPLYHYSETINSITNCRPIVRRSLQQAWDLAFLWNAHEPSEHHIAMPFQILIAIISISWIWGWKREAAVWALAWGALLRIGEVTNALRSDLIMPSDVSHSVDYVLIRLKEPKTRYRAARHQSGKLEQPDLIEIVRIGFQKLLPGEKLWPLSGSTLRHRLSKLLERLSLPSKDTPSCRALSLASMRPGGATWLMTACESAELVRRRGRWASFRIMEIYLQEVSAMTYMTDIKAEARSKVLFALEVFPSLFVQILKFDASSIPEQTWFWLLSKNQIG